MKEQRTTLLLNWQANPYHTPLFVAQAAGFYQDVGIKLALLEPNDPSDVTEIVGRGCVDLGLKAMIHTIAARAKGYPVVSFGTLLDEPPTGLIALKSSGISCFKDIVGRKVGYIGEFGKKIVDDLASLAGIPLSSYETVRVGMNLTDAIMRGIVDTGIGFINFQKVELEYLAGESIILRLDQLAGLGCCCFCSIQLITTESFMHNHFEVINGFMQATQRGLALTLEDPEQALKYLFDAKPALKNDMNRTIFYRTLPFFSRTLMNVERDWNKVFKYTRHLGIISEDFALEDSYTNDHVPMAPHSDLQPIACCLH